MSENKENRFIGFNRLKQSVTMEQVLERYGLLEKLRRGGDSLSGVCPLHQGHNPTQFRVSLGRDCWICFGDCHAGGSIIDFVSRMEKVGIREAGLLLQDWFSLKPVNGKEAPRPVVKNKVISFRKESNPPLRFSLGPLDGAHPYLQERGLTAETISTFGLGCCPHGMLRGWIAIPIHDAKGQMIAYAGRWPGTPPEEQPKYRLPRGFGKSLELFNQHRAMQENPAEPLVVVDRQSRAHCNRHAPRATLETFHVALVQQCFAGFLPVRGNYGGDFGGQTSLRKRRRIAVGILASDHQRHAITPAG